jgi:hypothetical protein
VLDKDSAALGVADAERLIGRVRRRRRGESGQIGVDAGAPADATVEVGRPGIERRTSTVASAPSRVTVTLSTTSRGMSAVDGGGKGCPTVIPGADCGRIATRAVATARGRGIGRSNVVSSVPSRGPLALGAADSPIFSRSSRTTVRVTSLSSAPSANSILNVWPALAFQRR